MILTPWSTLLNQPAGGQVLAGLTTLGNPYHGLIKSGQLHASQATKDAATDAAPDQWPHQQITVTQPSGGGTWAFSANPTFSRDPTDQAADALVGHRWDNYTLLTGRTRTIYGSSRQCGELGWLWADADGVTWLAQIVSVNITDAQLSFSVQLTRFGLFGAGPATATAGPVSLSWAEPLTTSSNLNILFQDASLSGHKAAFMVKIGADLDNGLWDPAAVFVLELSGQGATASAQVSEYLSRSQHQQAYDNNTPHETVTRAPDAVHAYLATSHCAPSFGYTNTGAPDHHSSFYDGIEYTLFVYFDAGGTLHRVSAAYEIYDGESRSRVDTGFSGQIVDIWPNQSSAACGDPYQRYLSFAMGSYQGTVHKLSYSKLGIKHDGAWTTNYLSTRNEGTKIETVAVDMLATAQQVSDCYVPSDLCALAWTSYSLYHGFSSPPYIGTVQTTNTYSGDLNGLFADHPSLRSGIWGWYAISKAFTPSTIGGSVMGWAQVGTDAGKVWWCRLEQFDREMWGYVLAMSNSTNLDATPLEQIEIKHVITPINPAGHPTNASATPTSYARQRIGAAPYHTYNRISGEYQLDPTNKVCII